MAVHRNARRLTDLAADADRLRIEGLVERYGNQWIATARRSCSTAADAEDAYQRALEKLLTQPPAEDDPERLAAWMNTVVRNEALQIVRSRRREVDAEFETIMDRLAADGAQPEEALVDSESHGIAKEALRRLRPDQTRCLLLRADGFDYPEICRITGFSYAKVNRLLSEGRKAARTRAEAIGGGRECQRIEPLLSVFVDGAADAAVEADVRLHLENCTHCQATARDYALAPRDLAALFPIGLAAVSWRGRLLEPLQQIAEQVSTRLGGGTGEQSAAALKKALAVVAVAATAVGGGAAIKHAADGGEDAAGTRATGPAQLITPLDAGAQREVRARAERRARARAAARRERSAERSAKSIADDPATPAEQRLNDLPADQDQGVAGDPADTNAPDPAADPQTGVLAP